MTTLTTDDPPPTDALTAVGDGTPSDTDGSATKHRWKWWRLNYLGLVGALLFIGLALTPSLLPRPWLFIGLIAGIAAAIGYGIGTFLSWAIRRLVHRELPHSIKRVAWWALAVLGTLWFIAAVIAGGRWQNQVRVLVGEPEDPAANLIAIAVITFVLAAFLMLIARSIRRLNRWINRQLGRVVPPRVAATAGFIIVALFLYWIATGLLASSFISWADTTYASANAGTRAGVTQPTAPERSGSTDSLASWESLGFQGRNFVGRGPTPKQISAFTGRPATEPIRIYVGVDTADTAQKRADIAVKELERTGAFERSVLVVAGATGTGWLEPQSVDSIEYMWGGDTAIATIQYSYLPSWISFLVDQERATEAGQALFEAVYDKWSSLPDASRPKLITYGLSLGSFTAQAAFGSVQDMTKRTDGALFQGTPNFSEPWGTVEQRRDAGSPEWQPIYQQGRTARFAATEDDLEKPGGPWFEPRVVFMQHASDPVVWWSYDLLTREPDWLKEPRGPDVSPETRWYPIITFLQVTVDQFFGVSVPVGHGHNYSNTIVYAWSNVVPPPAWTPALADELQALINAIPVE